MSSFLQLKDRSLVPPGGYYFDDPVTGMHIIAGDFESLMIACAKHRMVNKVKIPKDFNATIEDTLCQKLDPVFTRPERPRILIVDDPAATPNAKVEQLKKIWEAEGSLVCSAEEAQSRAMICKACPKNTPLDCINCNGVYDWLRQKFNVPILDGDQWLNSCGVDRVYNKAQVHLTKEVFERLVSPSKVAQYPTTCWKRKLLEAKDSHEETVSP